MSYRLTSNYLAGTIWLFDIERFDIEPKGAERRVREGEMDAVTSFELEAQRRRETVASDRDQGWARIVASADAVGARIVEPRRPRRTRSEQPDCEPAQLARQAVG